MLLKTHLSKNYWQKLNETVIVTGWIHFLLWIGATFAHLYSIGSLPVVKHLLNKLQRVVEISWDESWYSDGAKLS